MSWFRFSWYHFYRYRAYERPSCLYRRNGMYFVVRYGLNYILVDLASQNVSLSCPKICKIYGSHLMHSFCTEFILNFFPELQNVHIESTLLDLQLLLDVVLKCQRCPSLRFKVSFETQLQRSYCEFLFLTLKCLRLF